MAGSYKTPGVYIEEISKLPPSVAQVETAIPAFIGYTEKATKLTDGDLLFVPVRITSLHDYETYFGTVHEENLRINVQISYDMSGNISTVSPSFDGSSVITNMYYALQMYFSNGGGPCYIVSTGIEGAIPNGSSVKDDFDLGIDRILLEDEVTLFVFPDIHMLDGAEYYGVYDKALSQCNKLGDRFTIIDVIMNSDSTTAATNFRNETLGCLKYGAAYYPDLQTILNYVYNDDNVTVFDNSGARSLSSLKSVETLLYNTITMEIKNQLKVTLAPSSIMAGVYARVDSNRGVWKSPANEVLSAVIKPLEEIDDEDQKSLNVDTTSGKSINAIRAFTGKGVLVWGARTLAGNDNEWRYISVRRFFNMVEESIKKASSWVVFEPNNAASWTKVKSMISNYLITLWRKGALAGSSPDQAFFVKVGLGETMTSLDILEGRMNIEIGMAVVRPAEFIVLKFSHKLQEA